MNGELFNVRTSQIESSMLEARVHDLTIIIMNYCGAESLGGQQGNHKTALINDPLTKGYTLAVRYKQAYDEANARKPETMIALGTSRGLMEA